MTHFLGMIGLWQILLLTILMVIFIIPLIIAVVDIVRNNFEGSGKIVWLLVVLLLNPVGVVLYFLIGRKQRVAISNENN
ncbi:PLDc N-terminal domain-containing protein [Zhouia spongiae]|uniref:PLDc N-terminal domain-containing protein n=1 Tax=Zhouia spongiae TaxID=2202721 RepID=A0ABY3YP16_9FLAO|nr:PLDc N-terminal domain-containing protein [Zhouia spongiae]UNY99552.1 PLDc N-terminal domain-containing protein [Zhouia spongiae]